MTKQDSSGRERWRTLNRYVHSVETFKQAPPTPNAAALPAGGVGSAFMGSALCAIGDVGARMSARVSTRYSPS